MSKSYQTIYDAADVTIRNAGSKQNTKARIADQFCDTLDFANGSKVTSAPSGTLADNTIYKGTFTLSSVTLTAPTDNHLGIIIDRATIGSDFAFNGDYVGDTPESGSTYIISVLNGVWCFNEVYSQTNA